MLGFRSTANTRSINPFHASCTLLPPRYYMIQTCQDRIILLIDWRNLVSWMVQSIDKIDGHALHDHMITTYHRWCNPCDPDCTIRVVWCMKWIISNEQWHGWVLWKIVWMMGLLHRRLVRSCTVRDPHLLRDSQIGNDTFIMITQSMMRLRIVYHGFIVIVSSLYYS